MAKENEVMKKTGSVIGGGRRKISKINGGESAGMRMRSKKSLRSAASGASSWRRSLKANGVIEMAKWRRKLKS
jgi:hypothetical protein